jgi:hypothetical protein
MRLVFLIALFSWITLASAGVSPDWRFLTDTPFPQEGKAYIDVGSLQEKKGVFDVYSKLVLDLPRMGPGRVILKEYREHLKVDCAKRELGLVRVGFYDKTGHELRSRAETDETRRFAAPIAGSHHQKLVEAVCARQFAAEK